VIASQDFLSLADNLVKATDEASWRTAVSRAYYAAFHEARRWLRTLGFQVPKAEQAHAYLWLRLSNCGDQHLQQAGTELKRLRRDRNVADYDIEQSLRQPDARLQVQNARRVIQQRPG
jgi:uncharacterized protein (UPF0332 family)